MCYAYQETGMCLLGIELELHVYKYHPFLQYLKNVYLAHGLREIKLSDFDHLSPK